MKRILCFGWLSARISFLPGLHTLPFPSYTIFFRIRTYTNPILTKLGRFRLFLLLPLFTLRFLYNLFAPLFLMLHIFGCNACTKKS